MFGLPGCDRFTPDRWLDEGDRVQVGEVEFEVRHCPGHTPGHVVFYSAADRVAFVGDVLFAGSIGRTDFPGRRLRHADPRDPREAVYARRRRALRAGARADVHVRRGAAQQPVRAATADELSGDVRKTGECPLFPSPLAVGLAPPALRRLSLLGAVVAVDRHAQVVGTALALAAIVVVLVAALALRRAAVLRAAAAAHRATGSAGRATRAPRRMRAGPARSSRRGTGSAPCAARRPPVRALRARTGTSLA